VHGALAVQGRAAHVAALRAAVRLAVPEAAIQVVLRLAVRAVLPAVGNPAERRAAAA
jgi:hypothetical protein